MITWILFLTLVVGVLLYFLLASLVKFRQKLAPGPTIWPLIGNIVEIRAVDAFYPHLALAKLAKKYGNVMGLGFGPIYAVVISGYDEMKELLRKPETNESRYEFPYVRDRSYNQTLGLVFSNGEAWWEIRRFTVRGLRDHGFEKQASMEALIAEEAEVLVQIIKANATENNGVWAVDPHHFGASVTNVIWIMVAGYRFDHNDPVVRDSLRHGEELFEILGLNNIYNTFPFLKRWFPKLVKHDVHMKVHRELQAWMTNLIDDVKRKRAQRVDTEAHNFIETFLDEIERNRGRESNFTEEQMIMTVLDLFLAGSGATSTLTHWIILFLTLNAECQRKLRLEIEDAKARFGHLQMSICAKLPYSNAVVLEAARLGNMVPIPASRLATKDIHYADFIIPKGTAIFPNTYPIFMDADFWGDPEVFRPERFLDDAGAIIPKLAERMAMFGFSKRKCPGENLAMESVLMFTIAIFEKLALKPIEGKEPSAEKPISTLTIRPRPFSVRVVQN